MKAAKVEPWDPNAQRLLTEERTAMLREEHGLWRDHL